MGWAPPAISKICFKRAAQAAASSIAAMADQLNLAEGSGKISRPDQRRFYSIAMGSLREVQAVLALAETPSPELEALADRMGAQIYRLIGSRS